LLLIGFVLSVQAKSKAEKAAAIDAATDAVDKIAKLCQSAKNFSANTTAVKTIEKDLDAAADRVDSEFKERRSGVEANFSKVEKEAASDPNLTAELLEINRKLDALDVAQRHALSKAMGDIIAQALKPADKALKQSKKAAHDAIHPLYSLGDAAEDHADKLNDDLTKAFNCVEHANSKLTKQIGDHAEHIEHEGKKLLKQAAHKREAALSKVSASAGAAVLSFASKPAAGSSFARASVICPVFIASLIFGAIVMFAMEKFTPSASEQGLTTPLCRL